MSNQYQTEERVFIELDRQFRKMEKNAKTEELVFESYTAFLQGRNSSFNWETLLQENRVVILGEAGSGKSWELRERARVLSGKGIFALFIRLDQLIDRELDAVLSLDEQMRLLDWKRTNEVAYFFLDSVDEAKFRKMSDFSTALRAFHNGIGVDALIRAKIFLSSRISEWRPPSDEFEFRQLFSLPETEIRSP